MFYVPTLESDLGAVRRVGLHKLAPRKAGHDASKVAGIQGKMFRRQVDTQIWR